MDGETASVRDARIQALWQKLDTKKKGNVDFEALKNGLTRMKHPLKDADDLIKEILTTADVDHNGRITFDDFSKFCQQTEKELWSLFQSIDRDHNGDLDKKELSAAFSRAGVGVSNARLDRFFNYIDKDHDGLISYEEWRDFLLFLPTHSRGLQAVISYYNSTTKVTSEGDVAISDENLQGLGTTIQFLKNSFFGAVTQIAHSPVTTRASEVSTPVFPEEDDEEVPPLSQMATPKQKRESLSDQDNLDEKLQEDDDPYIPLRPARRKEFRLTDFIPDVGYFLAGGLSGITSRTATAPLDRLKVYLIAQTDNASDAVKEAKTGNALKATQHGASALAKACRELWKAGGIRSLFAGNGINIVKVMPESAVKFGSYEAAKRAVASFEGHDDPKHISAPAQFVAGGCAGMISQAVVYPLDTLKFRMQCEVVPGGERGNKLLFHTAQKMWNQGALWSFYRGLPMGLIGMFPYAAIDLFTFETLKKAVIKRNMEKTGCKHEEDALPNSFVLALMGGFSGAIGASMVYPLNLLRTRLQSQGTAGHPRTYTGILDVTRQTLKYEGVRGLFKGLTPNLLKVVPAVSITYVVYENTKKALHLH